jgi:hypothetical protein
MDSDIDFDSRHKIGALVFVLMEAAAVMRMAANRDPQNDCSSPHDRVVKDVLKNMVVRIEKTVEQVIGDTPNSEGGA